MDFEGLEFKPFNTLNISNLVITDNSPVLASEDTIAKVSRISLSFSLKDVLSKELRSIHRLRVEDGYFSLVNEGNHINNLKRVLNKEPKSPEPMNTEANDFAIREVDVDGFRFRLHNITKDGVEAGGSIDWADLDLTASLQGQDLVIGHGYVEGKVDRAEFTEKSGYHASHLSGSAKVGQHSVAIKSLRIEDDWSSIFLPELGLTFSHAWDFRDFTNKVSLGADIKNSSLSARTLHAFAAGLDLGDIEVTIPSGSVSGPVNDLKIKGLKFYGLDIEDKVSDISGTIGGAVKSLTDISNMSVEAYVNDLNLTWRENRYAAAVSVLGDASEFDVSANVKDNEGEIETILTLSDVFNREVPMGVRGFASTNNVNIGKFIDKDFIGECSLEAFFNAVLGSGRPSIEVEKMSIAKLRLLDYVYSGISASGRFDGKTADASIDCADPNLKLSASGSTVLPEDGKGAAVKMDMDLGFADLGDLKVKFKDMSEVSARISADYSEISKTNTEGTLEIRDLILSNGNEEHRIGDISIRSLSPEDNYSIDLDSDFIKGRFSGNTAIFNLPSDIKTITLEKDLPSILQRQDEWEGHRYDINLSFGDSRDILAFLIPGLYIAEGSSADLSIDETGIMEMGMTSPRIAFKDKYIKEATIKLDNREGHLVSSINGEELNISSFNLNNSALELSSSEDRIGAKLSFESGEETRGEIAIDGLIGRSGDNSLFAHADIMPSELSISGMDWRILPASADYDKDGVTLNSLVVKSDSDSISLSGAWKMLEKKIEVSLSDFENNISRIKAEGSYAIEDRNVDLNAAMDGFEISCISPFVQDFISGLSGHISGEITAHGPVDKLKIKSRDARLEGAGFTFLLTGAKYFIDGPFSFDSNGVTFDQITLADSRKGRGTLTGGILLGKGGSPSMDAHIELHEIECVNLKSPGSIGIYGKANGSGTVDFTGPLKNLKLGINVATVGSGDIHIPLGSNSSGNATGLLVFKEYDEEEEIDPYEEMMTRISKMEGGNTKSRLGINLNVIINPEINAIVELDNTSGGNGLTGRGQGMVSLDIKQGEDLNFDGEYNIFDGNFHFSALGIANKDFAIQNGSSIKFAGDIMDSDLDINALYRTKTSLSNLLADSTSYGTRRNVECGIRITEKLRNPKLDFSVEVPDLDPTTKSLVESALNTEDKIQKQFLSLLVTNSFLPDEQSGIVNNSTLLYSNVAEIMAGQLNNILQKLDIPLDLGLNYQPTEGGTDIFDVAVSTQLFNNKVSVNGTIGNRQFNSTNANDLVGDLDIEVKLNRPGSFRLNLFSHSADQYSNYLDYTQRNGIGLSYQKEFDNLREFLRDIFSHRKSRREESSQDEEMVIIRIDEENER